MYLSLILFTAVFSGSDKFFTFMRRNRKASKLFSLEFAEKERKEALKNDPKNVKELL